MNTASKTKRSWHRIASDLVDDARRAGFEVKSFDSSLTGQSLLDRNWYMLATEVDHLRFMEWGQP